MTAAISRRAAMPVTALALALLCAAPLRAAGLSCADWSTTDFWERAAVADVERCLAAGADVDARNVNDSTPLHFAARHGHTDTVQALLDAGTNPAARNMHGKTPFDLAEDMEGTDVYWRLHDGRFE